MKRPLTIAATAILAMLILYACSSTIRTATTSFVTITIGGPVNTAVLKAEAATPWARFKYFLADVKLMPEAYAYIPSIVQAIIVTVTAPDITTPIVGVSNLSSNQTIAEIRIEVPNGAARKFTIEGIHGVTSLVTYRSSTEADLNGTDITLPITMQFNFFGSAIFVDSALGNDTIYSGLTYTRPFKTISRALSLQSSSTPYNTIPVIWVEFGDYLPAGAGGGETFPLRLNPGTAIVCGGHGFTSTIGSNQLSIPSLIVGNNNASIDNCLIRVGQGGTGVNDVVNPQPPIVTGATRINGSAIQVPLGATALAIGVSFANDNSVIIDSAVTGTGVSGSAVGVQVNGGKPTVIATSFWNLSTGLDLASNAGDALVTANTISGNTNGITISSIGKPTVENNTISDNTTGIVVNNGAPLIRSNIVRTNFTGISIVGGTSQISNNSIDHNNAYGVNISTSTGNAKINQNSIFCNSTFDIYILSAFTAIDLQDNAWDHDAGTNPAGPLVSNTGGGLSSYDIIFSSPTPTPLYDRIRPAVPGGCVLIPIQ